ncbi:MAG: hypothetical protein WD407_03635 [Rhodospirillales bacterium]
MIDFKKKLSEKILETLANKISYGFFAVVGILYGGGISFEAFPDPFYHSGWIKENYAWFFLFVPVSIITVIICFWFGGLIIITIIFFLSAIGFAILYKIIADDNSFWLLITWILHGLLFSIFPGMISGWLILGWRKLNE